MWIVVLSRVTKEVSRYPRIGQAFKIFTGKKKLNDDMHE